MRAATQALRVDGYCQGRLKCGPPAPVEKWATSLIWERGRRAGEAGPGSGL
jgi:hypothetical protein